MVPVGGSIWERTAARRGWQGPSCWDAAWSGPDHLLMGRHARNRRKIEKPEENNSNIKKDSEGEKHWKPIENLEKTIEYV